MLDATDDHARFRVAELEAELVAARAHAAALTAERDRFREGYQKLKIELELMRRRLFVAKAERIDTAQLELEFAGKLAALDALARQIEPLAPAGDEPPKGDNDRGGTAKRKRTSTGRRDLRDEDLPEHRIEVADPDADDAAAGAAPMTWEESCQVLWRRGGFVRVIIARPKHRNVEPPAADAAPAAPIDDVPPAEVASTGARDPIIAGMSPIYTVPMPPMILPKSICTPSLIAHIVTDKFCDGLPLYRQEERSARLGFRIDRGTMSRWIESVGATAGATVVHAMRDEALRTAFCISTDATGILIQPIKEKGDLQRRACRRGHFFVQIADADHVFFEFTPRETSAAVGELFKGFSGYVQADAKSVYDLLFKPPSARPPPDDGEPDLAERHEVGCWSHARRRVWETAIIAKDPVAREGLLRIKRIFDLDRTWRGRPAGEIKALRDLHLRPHTDAFFAWVAEEYARVKDQRGMLRSALGYAHRQRGPLTRFFDDGRLKLTNNESERELRRIAIGRKAWLFVGSDDHAQAAGNLLSLVASARLHRLDPETYLRDLFRVLPQWPRERYLELAPRYWLATRARIDAKQLELEVGWLTIPPPLPATEQSAAH